MKKLFTLLVIFTFLVSALSLSQVQRKEENKQVKQINKLKVRDDGIKSFISYPETPKAPFSQNNNISPVFLNQQMSPNAVYTESFDGTTFPPTGWTNLLVSGTNTWTRETAGTYPTQTPHSGTGEAKFNCWDVGGGVRALITPVFDLSGIGVHTATVSVWMYRDGGYNTTADKMEFYVNTAISLTGATLLVTVNRQIGLAPIVVSNGWYQYTYNVPAGFNTATNYFILKATGANGNNIYIDDVSWGYPATPSLSVAPSSLAFGYTASGGTSAEMTYALSGSNLTAGPITVTAPANFEVSLTGSGTGFGSSVDVSYTPPTLASTTIYARFKPTSFNTAYSGNITNAGGGATTLNVAVTGNSYLYSGYCTSNATYTDDEDIFNVTLGTINNTSTCATTGDVGSILNKYSNYTISVSPTNLEQGSANAFSISSGTCAGNYSNAFKIFIDFNQDGDFADAGEEVYVSPSAGAGPHTETGFITVPGGATLGNTMMRVINVETSTPSFITACGTYSYGETEDYLVNIIAGTPMVYISSDVIQIGRPAPLSSIDNQIVRIPVVVSGLISPFTVTDFNLGTDGTTRPADISTAKIYYTGTSSTFSTAKSFGSYASPNGAFVISGSQELASGTNYFWLAYNLSGTAVLNNQLDAVCNSITGDGTMGTVIPTNPAPSGVSYIDNYCYGTTTNDPAPYGLYISNVTFGSINNTTGSTGIMPYMNNNYTSLTTSVAQSAVVPISLSRAGTSSGQGFSVWIDYNQNNSFADDGELVYTGVLTGATLTTSGNITIPLTAAPGNTRMRVRSNFSTAPLLSEACTNLDYSETENYTVNIVAGNTMTYVSSTATGTSSTVWLNSANQEIIGIQVVTTGPVSPLTVTNLALNTTGTTAAATDIANAKIFYTGNSSTFAVSTQFGTTVAAPNGTFNATGTQNLLEGINYFWLTYDITAGATPGNLVDGQCTQVTIGATPYTPTVTAPGGYKTILGTLAGTYAIGSGLFNKITGKNIYQVEKTRKVIIKVPVEEKGSENLAKYVEKEITEKYYEMYENNKPYEGILAVNGNDIQQNKNIGNQEKASNRNQTKLSNENQSDNPQMSPDSYIEVYADISTAISNLHGRGIGGPVIFEFTDETPYSTGAVTINAIAGASATNTITFKPKALKTVTGSSATGIFNLNGSDYIIFDGSNSGGTDKSLTITNTSATSGYAINFPGTGNNYNTIKNCNIKSEHTGINIANANTTLIENNNISGNVAGNTNYSQAGVYIYSGSLNTKVSKNIIHDFYYTGTNGYGCYGIYYYSDATTVTEISNNLIYAIKGGGDPGQLYFNTSGIYLGTGGNVRIYYNSIYMSGDVLGSGGFNGFSCCILIDASITLLDIKNNALQNSMGRITGGTTSPLAYLFYSASANTAFTDINYNDDYYTDQTNVTEYIGYLSTNRADLSAWRTATGKDANSVSADPGFTSTTNLIPNPANANCWNIKGGAYPLASVTTDFAGTARRTAVTEGPEDIGAYKFTPGVDPNPALVTGAITDGGTTTLAFAGTTIATIIWHTGTGTLPTSISAVFKPGATPPGTLVGTWALEYLDITATGGTAGYNYDLTLYYNLSRTYTINVANI